MTMLLVTWARELSSNGWLATGLAMRHACAPRLNISRATLVAIARRASVSCHLGICNASSSTLMVVAKVEKDRENLIGLIHGFTNAAVPGATNARAANTGTTRSN